jgi:hypothetical protein
MIVQAVGRKKLLRPKKAAETPAWTNHGFRAGCNDGAPSTIDLLRLC